MNKILAFDIAITTGWCIMINGVVEATGHFKFKTPTSFYNELSVVLDKWKPTHVIAASPTRFHTVIFKHGRLYGLFDLALCKRGLEFWMDKTAKGRKTLPIDSRIKKSVLGKGKASKDEIMEWAGISQEDEADAVMFATYLNNILNE